MPTDNISYEEIQRRPQIRAAKANKQKTEAAKAMLDHNAGRNAEPAKTVRLRALRLSKEAADAKLKNESEMAKPQKTARKKKVTPVS
jgi:hypothetical protein